MAGVLDRLPPEVRKLIYANLLVEKMPIPIKRHALSAPTPGVSGGRTTRMYSNTNAKQPKHRGHIYNRRTRKWVPLPPPPTELLRLSKLVYNEAAEILYGHNKYEFGNAGALERFLLQIRGSIQHLHHIGIMARGVMFMHEWSTMDRCLEMLAEAQGLRTLEVSHLEFCTKLRLQNPSHLQVKTFAEHCVPLLDALEATFTAKGLNFNVENVLKISISPCNHRTYTYGDRTTAKDCEKYHDTPRRTYSSGSMLSCGLACGCRCVEADRENSAMQDELDKAVVYRHKPSTSTGT